MKSIYNKPIVLFLLTLFLGITMGCSEKYEYNTDYSYYDDVKLKVNLVDENNVLAVSLANGSHAITVAVTPEDVFIDPTAYIYEIADPTIATISSKEGMLQLLKVGETTLTVKFRGNHDISTSCTLRVEPTLVSDLQVTGGDIRVEEGKELDLSSYVTVVPSSADNKELRYEVKAGSEEYAEIAEGSSIVKGLKEGPATIVVSTTDGSDLSTEILLTVTGKIPVERIDLGKAGDLNGKSVAIGQTFDLGSIIAVYPSNASEQTLSYDIVAGESAITIDENGVIQTVASGDVEISISATDEFQQATPQTIKFKVDKSLTLFERALWSVDTSIVYADGNNYTPDGTTGLPSHLIDGKNNTYLALTKPGKTYNGHTTPANHTLYFLIDMGSEQEFNYFRYIHRNNNQNFQAFTISLYGSNDKVNFTEIEKDVKVGPAKEVTFEKSVGLSKYKYVKVEFNTYLTSAGYNITVAEFNVGKK